MNALTKIRFQGYSLAMLFLTFRAPLSPMALAFCAALVTTTGCPKPSAIKVPPPPPGDLLRFVAKQNDKLSGKVNVRFEDGDIGAKKPAVYTTADVQQYAQQVQSLSPLTINDAHNSAQQPGTEGRPHPPLVPGHW